MTGRGAVDGIQRFGDPVQRRVGTDRHVGAEHVVVDRADQPHQPEERVRGGHLGIDLARVHQLGQQLRPLLAEQVRAGQAAVTADHDQGVDAEVQQVARCPPATVPLPELHRPGRPQDRAAALQDPAHIRRLHLADGISALDQPQVALGHRVDVDAVMHRCPHHRADGWVHAPGVAAAGEHCDAGGPSSGGRSCRLGHEASEGARTRPVNPTVMTFGRSRTPQGPTYGRPARPGRAYDRRLRCATRRCWYWRWTPNRSTARNSAAGTAATNSSSRVTTWARKPGAIRALDSAPR